MINSVQAADPEASGLPLQAGDVRLPVGDRDERGCRHAREILAGYRSGETAALRVRRQQREESLEFHFP